MNNNYNVLLYYYYVNIENPEEFRNKHKKICDELNLLGRIYVANEGINGTLSGTKEETNKYMEAMKNDPLFPNIIFKIDETDSHVFKKMHVRVKKELVNLSLEDDINPLEITGNYVEPVDFYQKINNENTIIIDARNDYEFELGHFAGAINPNIKTFREIPKWVEENKELLEGKEILTYCTGGIRCEKFSGYLKREGFDNVGQLHGGIATYGKDETTKGKHWNGQLYVFDDRIAVPVNRVDHIIVGRDYFDGSPCERYINCANPSCNKQILTSKENEAKYLGGCSDECRRSKRNRYVIANNLSEEEVNLRLSQI